MNELLNKKNNDWIEKHNSSILQFVIHRDIQIFVMIYQ